MPDGLFLQVSALYSEMDFIGPANI